MANADRPLNIPTYVDTDNHATHPRVFKDETKKYGYEWIMVFTPYSQGQDQFENPLIVVSDNGIDWFVPKGLTNPIVAPEKPDEFHFSDTDLFDNGEELELWFRESDKINDSRLSRLLRMTSTDAVNWSEPEITFDFGTGGYGYGSPSVVMMDGEYQLYYREHMNLNSEGYVLQKARILGDWSEKEEVVFDFGENYKDYVSWHVEINYMDGKYVALNHAAKDNQFFDGKLFLFESDDGIHFYNPKLLISKSLDGFDHSFIYKSSVVKHNNKYWIYYSAFNTNNENYIGLTIGKSFNDLIGYKVSE
ncbi:hypothetical protein H1Z61_00790 [Bacillus aquiflavi]|uniref:Uncharacterized protein n=1 Tax=Bacillus aquiflavi TaxID=2672567 RepID=A0A6B3VP46_9BACI|nr:hypothetical protein [Bacillus aquiflavi]MBA4535704.1 hypothetical protein [Bacillus aquiflavi]NEY80080.1 hypothetical protein [Bacillus aquiflavi]UAC49009.1 hypothetical protein K6959_03620 [Bacillus aquiflavi]